MHAQYTIFDSLFIPQWCLMTAFFYQIKLVLMQCILQWKIKHNKIDKGGEGEEGGFKPAGNHVLKSEASIIFSLWMHFLKTFCTK